jgi:membrane-associated phospholipid phosphatase
MEEISREIKLRQTRAHDNRGKPLIKHSRDTSISNYGGVYSKGLPHDNGYVDRKQIKKLLRAIKHHDQKLISKVKMGGNMKLVDPTACWGVDYMGHPAICYPMKGIPCLSSHYFVWCLAELYWMALCRDVPFDQYQNSDLIKRAVRSMNSINGNFITDTIFRGHSAGDKTGPYISQFLILDYPEGGWKHSAKLPVPPALDYMISWTTATSVQSGIVTETAAPLLAPRYIVTGRDLTMYVHSDEPCQAFYRACNILLSLNIQAPNALTSSLAEAGFAQLGRPDIQDVLHRAMRLALVASWQVKWTVMFIRPEVAGIAVERARRESGECFVHQALFTCKVLDEIFKQWHSYLLPQAYPEGSPCHPSFPAGHAAISGACIFVLKFFFLGETPIKLFVPNADGSALIDTGLVSTVEGELDKLASNIAFGRNWAGIHYRFDGEDGIKLGEDVAISLLRDLVRRYPCPIKRHVKRFNGKTVIICN